MEVLGVAAFIKLGLSIQGSWLLLILCLLGAVGVAFYAYRYTIPPVTKSLRRALMALRAAALVLLVLLLFQPILSITRSYFQKPTIAVLVDNSASMTIRDNQHTRAEIVLSLLQHPAFEHLQRFNNLRFFTFADHLYSLKEIHPDSLQFNFEGTDIYSALVEAKQKLLNEYLAGVVLLTDGIYNVGENPLFLAQSYGLPIFIVGIGDPQEKKDVLIARVLTNEVVYAQNKVPVEVVISSYGYDGMKIPLSLKYHNQVVDSKLITLVGNYQEQKVRLTFVPQQEGFQKYVLEIPKLKGEFTTLNNKHSFFVKVLKSKIRVLLLAGAPSADLKFIKRILEDDKDIELTVRTQKKGGGFYERNTEDNWTGKDYEVIFFLGFPRWPVDKITRNFLTKQLLKKNKPVFFLQGPNLNIEELKNFQDALPFTIGTAPGKPREVSLQPTVQGEQFPLIRLQDDFAGSLALWKVLPPVSTFLRNFNPRPESQVLVVVDPKQSKLPNTDSFRKPLILARTLGEHKELALLFHNVWRWDLMMWGVNKTNEALVKFLNRSIRWLTTPEEIKLVKIQTDKLIYRNGEVVHFLGQVYTPDYQPLDNAEVAVTIHTEDGKRITLPFSHVGNGKYQAEYRIAQAGDYRFEGQAFLDGQVIGSDQGRFSAGEFHIEFVSTRMREGLLQKMAQVSGGKYYTSAQIEKMSNELHFPPQQLQQTREINLWNKWLVLLLFIGLLVVEWSIRRRKGML